MKRGGSVRPRTRRRVLLAGVAVLSAVVMSGATGSAAVAGGSVQTASLTDPIAGHPYRHGAVPLRELVPAAAPAETAPPKKAAPTPPARRGHAGARRALSYRSGSVVTGSPKVYLVFWGSQWGTTGDPDGLAANLQAFVSGLGTDHELWSTIVTQYCQGVAFGSKACPVAPAGSHVAYPSGNVLGGVVPDIASLAPQAATATQIAQQAENAAASLSFPANAQYIVVSPSGTDPDGWLDPSTGYCAYHDDTGDSGVGGFSPAVPYTNLPYVPDVGNACSSFTNPAVLDGADETFSHEYAETQTDPFPASGWSDARGNEIADKCENLAGGSPGGANHLVLATGTFVVQGLWANDNGRSGGCENRHVSELLANPGKQRSMEGTPVAVPIAATDVEGLALSFSATGLPAGLAIDHSTGVISGIPSARGRFHVTVQASDSVSATSVVFTWTVRR